MTEGIDILAITKRLNDLEKRIKRLEQIVFALKDSST